MKLKDPDHTPEGYVDAIENAVLDTTAALRALRVAKVPTPVMLAGAFDQWRDVEFDEAGAPTVAMPVDEPVLARGMETMLATVAMAPRTDHVTEAFSACLEQLHHSWIMHRRLDRGHEVDDGCRLCHDVVVAADVSFNDLFDYASCYPYATEDAAA